MDSRISDLIDSPNPQDRRRAIDLLIKDGSQEAVTYLSALYRTEKDPELRDLAVQAGKEIRRRQQASQWEGEGDSKLGELAKAKAKRDDYVPVPISEMQRTRAESLVELAMNRSVAGDNVAAQRHITKAFQINPNFLHDSYMVSVAADIFNVSPEDVPDVIDAEGSGGGRKAKRKSKDGGDFDDAPSWGDALTNVLIYMLVIGAVSFVSTLFYFQIFGDIFSSMQTELQAQYGPNWTTMMGDDAEIFLAMTSGFQVLGIAFSAVSAVSGAIGGAIGLFIWFAMVHFVSTTLLAGTGTYRGVIYHTTNIYTVFTALYGIIGFILMVVSTNLIFDPLVSMSSANLSTREIDMAIASNLNNLMGIFGLVGLLTLLGYVWFLYATSKGIAKNYQFGTGTGCISQILSYIALMIVVFGCSCGFVTLMGSTMSAAVGYSLF